MSNKSDLTRFRHLTFDDFRRMAQDDSLSHYEKIGFPDSYREGKGEVIFADIRRKLPNLDQPGQTVIDIGPGCSDLPRLMIDLCREKGHSLVMIDAKEMLDQLPDAPFLRKVPAYYPDECPDVIAEYAGKANAILAYGLFSIIFDEGNVFRFTDTTLSLLAEGGQWLLGEIPSFSKRQRFFSSANGIRFHQEFMATTEAPQVTFNAPHPGEIDDSVFLSLLMRCRLAGFDSYLVPQPPDLPMANRREDLLIFRP